MKPRLDILPPPQRSLWDELGAAIPSGFVLYGGTGLALRLGHRSSEDFDFFSNDLEHVAKRLFWWKPPAEALEDQRRFLAQVMTYGTIEDLSTTLRHFPRSALREVLKDAPPGVFDIRSWHYWHLVFGMTPVPELPKRRLA